MCLLFFKRQTDNERRKANLFCSLVFSVPLSDVTPVWLVLPGGSSSGSGGGAVYKRPSHTHRLTQKFKVGALPPAQVLGNNGFFFFFQYLLKPKSSSTVSSSVRNQTTTGRDHESSPRAKRQPFSNKVRLLMRLNSNWPAERESSQQQHGFHQHFVLFSKLKYYRRRNQKKTKTQYIIDSPLIICAYSIYESGCITASIVYVAQELLPQVTKSGGDDVTKGRRRELRVKEPRIPWRVF